MNNSALTQLDVQDRLDATDKHTNALTSRAYTALGAILLAIEPHVDAATLELLTDHLLVIDEATRLNKETVLALTNEMGLLAAFVDELRNQRDDAVWSIKDEIDRADEAESNAEANIYQRMLENFQEMFGCEHDEADKLLGALWDKHADVDGDTSELLDMIANTINHEAD